MYMHPAPKIRALMILQGLTNKDIARKTGVSKTWVSLVLCGHVKSERIRQAIAAAVGVPVEELWPEDNNKAA